MSMADSAVNNKPASGERVARDLVQLIREIVPLLENVRHSIEESTNHIPKASKQLSNVTQATESATVEILNVLESMTNRITQAEEKLGVVKRSVELTNGAVRRLQAAVSALPEAQRKPFEEAVADVNAHLGDRGRDEGFRLAEEFLAKTKEESMSIAISLQVQDITSQQIAGVAHIIEGVREQLASALFRFENGTAGADIEETNHFKDKVFDTNAQYTKSPERQSDADEIVRQFTNGKQ